MSNYSVLEQNILHAIEGACDGNRDAIEDSQAIFLRWKDRDSRLAEFAAYEWTNALRPFLSWVLPIAVSRYKDSPHAAKTVYEVLQFIRERHVRRYFPGN